MHIAPKAWRGYGSRFAFVQVFSKQDAVHVLLHYLYSCKVIVWAFGGHKAVVAMQQCASK